MNVPRWAHAKTYTAWVNMIQRVTNSSREDYVNYGGRGIKVCDSWKDSYLNFVNDMGFAPEDKSLDRIDNDKDYCKENCRWSTHSEQMLNRRERSIETKLRPTNTTGVSGVYWQPSKGTWQVKSTRIPSRTFDNLLDACAYRLSATRHWVAAANGQ